MRGMALTPLLFRSERKEAACAGGYTVASSPPLFLCCAPGLQLESLRRHRRVGIARPKRRKRHRNGLIGG